MTKKEKCSKSQISRIVINKDNREKRIYISELKSYIEKGWKKGVSPKHRQSIRLSHKGKKYISKPCSEDKKQKISKTLKEKHKSGQLKAGRQDYWKTNHVAWNKGLTKDTDPRVRKPSESKKNHIVTEDTRKKISLKTSGKKVPKDKLEIKLTKQYITKKKNNSFNKSSTEEKFYKDLLEQNKTKTIYRQYKESRYPFYCDFYILEDDLFIELNCHWTHGGKPYDPNDPECIKKLGEWTEKAKKSKFFANAIDTWTRRDVEKQRIAKKNNLNYKVIY